LTDVLFLIRVHFIKLYVRERRHVGEFVKDWRNDFAGSTPWRPKVNGNSAATVEGIVEIVLARENINDDWLA
jgi:hypothetical protein